MDFRETTNSPTTHAYIRYCFWAFVLLYAGFLCFKPAFGLVDDHLFLPSILVGKVLPFYSDPPLGRFAPLEGQEYNLVAIISATPIAFYLFNVIELILVAWLLVEIGKLAGTNRKESVPYIAAAAIMLTPAFLNGWLRLLVPERNELVLLAIFFFCFLKFQTQQKTAYYVAGVVAAAVSLFCKETAFVLVGGLGFAHLVWDKQSNRKKRLFDVSLIAVSVLWLCIYYFASYRFRGPHLYGARPESAVHLILETFAFNVLFDPVITAGIFFLLLTRGVALLRGNRIDPVLDSVLISGALFFVAYLMLHLASAYYLLPLYALAPYLVASICSQPDVKNFFKAPVIALFAILFASQLSVAFQQIVLWKFAPRNFQSTLSALSTEIANSPKRVNIVMAGATRESDIYGSLEQYFAFHGIRADRLNLESDLSSDAPTQTATADSSGQSTHNPIAQGDYILVTPFDIPYRRAEFEDPARYQMSFETHSVSYPDMTAKTLVRPLLSSNRVPGRKHLVDPNFYVYKAIAP